MTSTRLLPLFAALALGGCSLAPDYHRPAAPIPADWPSGPAYGEPAATGPASPAAAANRPADLSVGDLGWRDFFRSDALRQVIGQALDNNRNLRVAALNIVETRAQYRIQRAELYPAVSADASVSRQHTPASVSPLGRATTRTQYSVELGVTAFEIDLFGRVRNLSEAALEQYFATQEARTSVQISLIAEVASTYLTLQADRQLLQLTEDTLKAQSASLALVQASFDRGIASDLDLQRARTSVETARANRAAYIRLVAQDQNALQLLIGAPLDPALVSAQPLALDGQVAALPAGLPSELLQRRPDIRAAEHRLKAANANIGAARAAFFPSISLTLAGGTQSSALSGLFTGGSGAWTFLPQVNLPIFAAGANEANLDAAKAQEQIAVAQYELAIQTAFREVSDALAARGTYDDQLAAQRALIEASQRSYDLSTLRYKAGIDSYLNVLDAQRSLYGAQQTLISTELAGLNNLVTLYESLGGGGFDHREQQAAR